MNPNSNPSDGPSVNPLDRLIVEYFDLVDSGKAVSPESFADNHPAFREPFLRFIGLADRMTELADTSSNAADTPRHSPQVQEPTGQDLGEYRILRTLGAGGMGIVYVGRHRRFGTLAAVKVLQCRLGEHRASEERFRREAQAIASLNHENIVPLIASGIEGDTAYLAMKFIDGANLSDVIREFQSTIVLGQSDTRTAADSDLRDREEQTTLQGVAATLHDEVDGKQVDFHRMALLAATVADALHAAHDAGILHRDVKPSNILVDTDGKAWLTDFGLASFSDERTALTATGEVVGTPCYMSPEQAAGPHPIVDARSDIYGLGATLYEWATFERPFDGNRHHILFNVIQGRFAPPRSIRPEIPVDLEAIIVKSMALSPAHRYQTADALAADLRRFARGHDVQAKIPGRIERVYRWGERNPLVALAAALGMVATIIATVTIQAVHSRQLRALNQTLESVNDGLLGSNATLRKREEQLRQQLYVSDLSAAFKAHAENDTQVVRQLLDEQRPGKQSGKQSGDEQDSDLRGIAWRMLDRLSQPPRSIELTRHDGAATEVAILPGGRQAISVGLDQQAHWFDLPSELDASGRDSDSIDVNRIVIGDELNSVAVSPDSTSFLTGTCGFDDQNVTRLYDIAAGEVRSQWKGQASSIDAAAISPDGTLFATADRYHEVQVHKADGSIVDRFTTDSRNESLAFFHNNHQIAAIFRDTKRSDSLKVRSINDGQSIDIDFDFAPKTFAISEIDPTDSSFSIVAGGHDDIAVIRWPDQELLFSERGVVGRLRCVDISPDGETVVAGCDDGTLRIWRDIGQPPSSSKSQATPLAQVIHASDQQLTSVRILMHREDSDSGTWSGVRGILTTCNDGSVKLWSLPAPNPRPLFDSRSPSPDQIALSKWSDGPDAANLYLRFADGSIGRLHQSLQFHRIAAVPPDSLGKLIATSNGEHLMVAGREEIIRMDALTGRAEHRIAKPDREQSCADMLIVADKLLVLFNDHLIVCDPETLKQLEYHRLPDDAAQGLVRVPGTNIVRVITHTHIHQLDSSGLSTLSTAPSAAENYSRVVFSEAGDRMATVLSNGMIQLQSSAGTSFLLRGHRAGVIESVFLDNARVLGTASFDETLRFWSTSTGREMGTLYLSVSAAHGMHYFKASETIVTVHTHDPPQLWTISPHE